MSGFISRFCLGVNYFIGIILRGFKFFLISILVKRKIVLNKNIIVYGYY